MTNEKIADSPSAISLPDNIRLNNYSYASTGNKTYFRIYDMNGRLMSSDSFNSESLVDASQWKNGIYMVNFISGGLVTNQKIYFTR